MQDLLAFMFGMKEMDLIKYVSIMTIDLILLLTLKININGLYLIYVPHGNYSAKIKKLFNKKFCALQY